MPFTIDGTVLTKYIPEENEGDDVVIVVPDGIETIGAEAFKECTTLTEIQIPDSVTDIAPLAFDFL